jgi:hypothetical protein
MAMTSLYSLHPSVAYIQAILDNLEVRTGKPLETWLRLVKARGPKDVKARAGWLKAQGLGSNQAALVADRSAGVQGHAFEDTVEGYLAAAPRYVEQQYGGKKAALRPLYERVLAFALASGPEAKACPCETIVPLYRNHVFAQIKPTTLTRIDLGLSLGDPAKVKNPGRRLLDTGGFARKDRLTHRIELTDVADLDGEVKRWLKVAYDRDA